MQANWSSSFRMFWRSFQSHIWLHSLSENKSFKFQLIFTFVILVLIDLAYRFFPVEGFNHPWINFENLGAWFNNKIEGVDKANEWATLNFVSTTAHTVWGSFVR